MASVAAAQPAERSCPVTAVIPVQRQPERALFDVAEVAVLLHRSPGYVRKLIAEDALTPVCRQGGERGGRPRMLFDARAVFALLDDTPTVAGRWWLTSG